MRKPEFFDERQGTDLAAKITDAPGEPMDAAAKQAWCDHLLTRPQEEVAVLLDSQLEGHPSSRYTLMATRPVALLQLFGTRLYLHWGETHWQGEADPWDALRLFRSELPLWMTGYLGYDLKNRIEALHSRHPDPVGAPDLWFMVPGHLQIYDRQLETCSTIEATLPQAAPPDILKTAWGLRRAEPVSTPSRPTSEASPKARGASPQPLSTHPEPESGRSTERGDSLHSRVSDEEYLQMIRRVQDAIREGEIYEMNLSRQMEMPCDTPSGALFRAMREAGPVPFAAWIRTPSWSVSCASPERFLCHSDGRLLSQPIKGTAPRDPDPDHDRTLRDGLIASEKERAENVMITDLVRHDLSRVCKPGTVQVLRLFEVQSFRTVHQLITTVSGEVRPDVDPVEMIRACFPMGSMTGAPKIRSMEWIERVERYRRGIYSGAIGYIAPDGEFDLNVVIRTAIQRRGRLWYATGGAITSDSDPEAELEETRVKTRALTRALQSL